ncbi:MAG: methyltransferase domain-containing protein [Gammaproteobacteria bacterium]|nr:methyltransferase domain-containing protein [Gammaproteobacteria bacterium]
MSRKVVNLGCGPKSSAHPDVLNVDWSVYLRFRSNPLLRWLPPLVLRGERLERYRSLPDNIVAHDLTRGIPLPDESADVVYHSHVLEHIDRDAVPAFQAEVRRVLKPGGVQRIVVPDLEILARRYVASLEAARAGRGAQSSSAHDASVGELLEQSVRKDAAAARPLRGWKRALYTRIFGDARARGETHQWMYDSENLAALLRDCGFRDIAVVAHDRSRIPGWETYGLDVDAEGRQYKPDSLYVEAAK